MRSVDENSYLPIRIEDIQYNIVALKSWQFVIIYTALEKIYSNDQGKISLDLLIMYTKYSFITPFQTLRSFARDGSNSVSVFLCDWWFLSIGCYLFFSPVDNLVFKSSFTYCSHFKLDLPRSFLFSWFPLQHRLNHCVFSCSYFLHYILLYFGCISWFELTLNSFSIT